jgi:uncharacterized glyoxalase superfamily protein PhnB
MPATSTDRLSNIVAAYMDGRLELDTCVAELTHLYVEHGWGFYLVEEQCDPRYRDRMRALADRLDSARATPTDAHPPHAPAHKPRGYRTVSPYLIVDGAARTIDFLVGAFGGAELRRFPAPDGRLRHAEVRLGDSVVMLADATPEWPAIPANVHVYVPDVDATYRRALEAGAAPVQEPVRKDDPDKRGGVRDDGGTTWWIATKVE